MEVLVYLSSWSPEFTCCIICTESHLHSLILRIFWPLTQKTGCLFYVIFSGGWVLGSQLPFPAPAFVPLYSDSLMKDICCAMPIIYTSVNALENTFWCSKLVGTSGYIFISSLFWTQSLQMTWAESIFETFEGQVKHWFC